MLWKNLIIGCDVVVGGREEDMVEFGLVGENVG